jgi:hypothetical protein
LEISAAQADVRTTFVGGFAGQLVSSIIWAVSAAAATWYSHEAGIVVLVGAGFFIFPLTQLALRLMGRPAALPKGHPMNALAMQVAFTLPLNLPLVAAATLFRHNWFYPAVMLILGTHYLPFVFLYGMPQFAALAAALIVCSWCFALFLPGTFTLGGWTTAALLLLFAFVNLYALRKRQAI